MVVLLLKKALLRALAALLLPRPHASSTSCSRPAAGKRTPQRCSRPFRCGSRAAHISERRTYPTCHEDVCVFGSSVPLSSAGPYMQGSPPTCRMRSSL